MAASQQYEIAELIGNADSGTEFDIDDVYDANLITNHGFHRDAKDLLKRVTPPAKPKATIFTDGRNEKHILIVLPMHLCYNAEKHSDPSEFLNVFTYSTILPPDSISDEQFAIGETVEISVTEDFTPSSVNLAFENETGMAHLLFPAPPDDVAFDNITLFIPVDSFDVTSDAYLFKLNRTSDSEFVFSKGALAHNAGR